MKLQSRAKMKKYIILLFVIFVTVQIVVSADSSKKKKAVKEICISFDELPVAVSFQDVDREAVTYLILQALKKYNVKAVGFVVGEQIKESFDILGEWLNSGHTLGNMTYSNQDFNQLGIKQFIDDVNHGEKELDLMVQGFGQKKRYFRYPYLHYGNTSEKKKQLTLYLDSKRLHVVPATVAIEDYLYNMTLDKMGKQPDTTEYFALMNEYINHVLDEIEASERLSLEVLNRPCKQIIKLRANRINAVFLDEMLGAIKEMGYSFISVDKALKDKAFHRPEAYFGAGTVNFLQMLKESDPDHLPAQ